ncbi:hypothetical protein NIES2101_19515 [Calothrix sp. HK-06]|nr:hypothetical protein NIES2101_19515 [Calothrix sp. HK-06]
MLPTIKILMRWASSLVLLLLTACTSKSSTNDVSKELRSVKSWAATAHMVGDAWKRGAVPTAYAKQTLKKTQEELKKETDSLSKSSIDEEKRASILKSLFSLQTTLTQMSTSIEHKSYKALTQEIQQLSAQEQNMTKLAQTASGQS